MNPPAESPAAIATGSGELRVVIASRIDDVADVWDALAADGAGTAYQSRAFIQSWVTHVAPAVGIDPRVGLVFDANRPVALLPFGLAPHGPLRKVVYLGGRDANFSMPLLASGVDWSEGDARQVLARYAAEVKPRPDLFILVNQPDGWRDRRNPFAFADANPSPSHAYCAEIGTDATAFLTSRESKSTRKKLRSKANHLAAIGPVSFARAAPDETDELVATFIAQKEQVLAARGVKAGLAHPHVLRFLSDIARARCGTEPTLDLYRLRVGHHVAATFGGLRDRDGWQGLFTSYNPAPEIARCSPGDLLLRRIIEDLARRGITRFDLGIGEASYKDALCDVRIPLVDTIVPVSVLGKLFARGEVLRLSAKRHVKQSRWAMKLVRNVRAKKLARRSGGNLRSSAADSDTQDVRDTRGA